MAIEPNRVEAAARAMWLEYCDSLGWPNGQPTWDEIRAWERHKVPDTAPGVIAMIDHRDLILAQAERGVSAAFPELASDPPTGWVAPWEATEAIEDVADAMAALREADGLAPDGGAKALFAAMRDAHTKEQTLAAMSGAIEKALGEMGFTKEQT